MAERDDGITPDITWLSLGGAPADRLTGHDLYCRTNDTYPAGVGHHGENKHILLWWRTLKRRAVTRSTGRVASARASQKNQSRDDWRGESHGDTRQRVAWKAATPLRDFSNDRETATQAFCRC